MQFLTEIFDFFLPRFCASCGIKLNGLTEVLCINCERKILPAADKRIQTEYDRKFMKEKLINDFTSLYIFEKDKELQNIIHHIKYGNKFRAGIYLGKKLGEHLTKHVNDWEIDRILPVPLHHLKKAERGYNQSYYIAKGIGKITAIKIAKGILKRTRYTQSQTTMNLKERQLNIANAFKVRKKSKVKGKNLLIVDDVITTGSTVNECARALIEAGAKSVYAASVAIAD